MPHFFPVLASQLSLTVSTGDWDHLTDRGTKLENYFRKHIFIKIQRSFSTMHMTMLLFYTGKNCFLISKRCSVKIKVYEILRRVYIQQNKYECLNFLNVQLIKNQANVEQIFFKMYMYVCVYVYQIHRDKRVMEI